MKADLIRIGNSRGIRIPKPIIEGCRLGDTVELIVEGDCLVISSTRAPRADWEERFRRAGSATNERNLLATMPSNQFDREEWKW